MGDQGEVRGSAAVRGGRAGTLLGSTATAAMASPTLKGGGNGGSADPDPTQLQQAHFYNLRKAFFGVLQKLLKRYLRGHTNASLVDALNLIPHDSPSPSP